MPTPLPSERYGAVWKAWLRYRVPLGIYALSRLVAVAALALGSKVFGDGSLYRTFVWWDTAWYGTIASGGYPSTVTADQESNAAFFPLHPMLGRAVAELTGVGVHAALVMVTAFFGVAFALVAWRLFEELTDTATANKAIALIAFFPGSVVFSGGYSEPLMLTLAAGCLLALQQRWWITAGLLAALATATRPNAVALCFACAVAAFLAWRQGDRRAVLAPLLSPLGAAAFLVYLWQKTGAPDAWWLAQSGWDEGFDFGVTTARRVAFTATNGWADLNQANVAVGVLVALVLVVVWWRTWKAPAPVIAYTAVILLLAIGAESIGLRPRFLLTAFPLFLALALRLGNVATTAVVGVSATLLGCLATVTVASQLMTP